MRPGTPHHRELYVNLPVGDLGASKAFFEALGFGFEPRFTDEQAACMILGPGSFVMLLPRPFFQTFTPRSICDTAEAVEALVAFNAQSRDEVDALVARALAAGATEAREPAELCDGFMYARSFFDLDGHQWEVLWMNEASGPPARRGEPARRCVVSVADVLEPHRAALTGHCYRMLGSPVDADDAVQETMVRAWRGYERFDGRSDLGTWLYRIATNVCIDQLRSRRRRELPTMLGPAGTVHDDLTSRPRTHWLEPMPDARAVPRESEPERQAELRQSLRLAFVAALQQLPAKQRAVLLLKDVLGFSTAEIAQTLELTPASIGSALQRARKTLATRASLDDQVAPLSPTQAELIERYVEAFHRYDVDALVALLREDGTLSMPPYTLWLQGREPVRDWLLGRGIGCQGSRLVPTAACGSPAFGQYRRGDHGYEAWSLVVLELGEASIVSMTHFLDVDTLFPLFGLEPRLPA